MGLSRPLLSAPLRRLPKAVCPSCHGQFEPVDHGGKKTVFCGAQACFAEGILAYWRTLGYEARVRYADGQPRLVGVPGKM